MESNDKLQEAIDNISQRSLPNSAIALGLAALYANNDRHTLAIETLEKLTTAGVQTAEIFFALGEVYENASSNSQNKENYVEKARENYTKALEVASQMTLAAKIGLAKIEDMQGKIDAASHLRQDAQTGLEALAEVERRLEEGQRVGGFVRGQQQFLFLAGGCGECAGPGYYFFRLCNPCN